MDNKRGRPFKAPKDRKSDELRIRLTVNERKALDGVADGKTSTWARELLLAAAKRLSKD
jgi:hypothetical protein